MFYVQPGPSTCHFHSFLFVAFPLGIVSERICVNRLNLFGLLTSFMDKGVKAFAIHVYKVQ